jgi:SAM-dependent methyltransferase
MDCPLTFPSRPSDEVLAELRALRETYHRWVGKELERRGIQLVDMALSAEGVAFVLQVLDYAALLRTRSPDGGPGLRILDMGCGFSTLAIGEWMLKKGELPVDYVGVDHDEDWLNFMVREVGGTNQRFFLRPPGGTAREADQHPPPRWIRDRGYDVIIVDHGPQLQNRADDANWLAEMLEPGGIMLFDDWRPKHEGRIRRALNPPGRPPSWAIGSAEWTRRTPRDKAIGWAKRIMIAPDYPLRDFVD